MLLDHVRIWLPLIVFGHAMISACGGKVLEEAQPAQGGHAASAAAGAGHGGTGGSAAGGSGGSGGIAAHGGSGFGGAGQGGSATGGGGHGGAGAGGSAGWGAPPGCFPQTAYDCNPLTNEPCDSAAGEACDLADDPTIFICYPAPNEIDLGQACDESNGPFCKATMTCKPNDIDASVQGTCRKFCCSLQDCPAGSTSCEALFPGQAATIGTCK